MTCVCTGCCSLVLFCFYHLFIWCLRIYSVWGINSISDGKYVARYTQTLDIVFVIAIWIASCRFWRLLGWSKSILWTHINGGWPSAQEWIRRHRLCYWKYFLAQITARWITITMLLRSVAPRKANTTQHHCKHTLTTKATTFSMNAKNNLIIIKSVNMFLWRISILFSFFLFHFFIDGCCLRSFYYPISDLRKLICCGNVPNNKKFSTQHIRDVRWCCSSHAIFCVYLFVNLRQQMRRFSTFRSDLIASTIDFSMLHKMCIYSALRLVAVVRCHRFDIDRRDMSTVELNCLRIELNTKIGFNFSSTWNALGTHQSLEWQPNVRCNFWPSEVFRFWTIFVFSVRWEWADGAWRMPNWRWKHMDCDYLNVIWLSRWNVATARTYTYVFDLVHERLPVDAQSVSSLRSWSNARSMNRHCTDHNTLLGPLWQHQQKTRTQIELKFTLPRSSLHVRRVEVNGCNWHHQHSSIYSMDFFFFSETDSISHLPHSQPTIYVIMWMLIVTKYVWIWILNVHVKWFPRRDLLNYALRTVSIVGAARPYTPVSSTAFGKVIITLISVTSERNGTNEPKGTLYTVVKSCWREKGKGKKRIDDRTSG